MATTSPCILKINLVAISVLDDTIDVPLHAIPHMELYIVHDVVPKLHDYQNMIMEEIYQWNYPLSNDHATLSLPNKSLEIEHGVL